jgi:HD-like signal output (HDOD) protein
MGILVLHEFLTKEFLETVFYSVQNKIPFLEAEYKVMGLSHQEIGEFLTDKWSLPSVFSDALQFHHRDHSTKEVTPARMKLWSREKARLELDKCDLVCANCHAEIHYEMRSVHPAIASPPVPEAMAEHRP